MPFISVSHFKKHRDWLQIRLAQNLTELKIIQEESIRVMCRPPKHLLHNKKFNQIVVQLNITTVYKTAYVFSITSTMMSWIKGIVRGCNENWTHYFLKHDRTTIQSMHDVTFCLRVHVHMRIMEHGDWNWSMGCFSGGLGVLVRNGRWMSYFSMKSCQCLSLIECRTIRLVSRRYKPLISVSYFYWSVPDKIMNGLSNPCYQNCVILSRP